MRIRSTQLKLLSSQIAHKAPPHKATSPMAGIYYMPKLKGEDEICNRIAIELKTLYQLKKLNCIFTHPRNETSNYIGFSKAKGIGMIPGAPDYFFISKDNHLLVEVKKEDGKLSDSQKSFKNWCESVDVKYIVVRSWNELKTSLKECNMIL